MRRMLIILWLMASTIGFGCATKQAPEFSPEDNPRRHTLQGMELLDQGAFQAAEKRFLRAVELDPEFARAHAGLAMVEATRAGLETDPAVKEISVERTLEKLDSAEDAADTPADKFSVAVSEIRAHMLMIVGDDWLEDSLSAYRRARGLKGVVEADMPFYKTVEAADYFMALANFEGGNFPGAKDRLSTVLGQAPGPWHDRSEELYRRTQRILLVSLGYTLSDIGARVAVLEAVPRADAAAIFVDELDLNRLFLGKSPLNRETGRDDAGADFIPVDIRDHALREEVEIVMNWNLRGFQPRYDSSAKAWLFEPQEFLSRKELAMALEDALIIASGDFGLGSRWFSERNSPFRDVYNIEPWYNAVVTVVTRGLMDTDLSGAFRPNDPVSGSDLLSAVTRLRNARIAQ